MAERTYTILDAGVGARVRVTRRKVEATITGIRHNRRARGLTAHLVFDDGTTESYFRPKELTLIRKAPLYVEWDTGQHWKVYGTKRYVVEGEYRATITKASKVVGWRGDFDPICEPDGYHVRLKGRKPNEEPNAKFATFPEALAFVIQECPADARPANHDQVLVGV